MRIITAKRKCRALVSVAVEEGLAGSGREVSSTTRGEIEREMMMYPRTGNPLGSTNRVVLLVHRNTLPFEKD